MTVPADKNAPDFSGALLFTNKDYAAAFANPEFFLVIEITDSIPAIQTEF